MNRQLIEELQALRRERMYLEREIERTACPRFRAWLSELVRRLETFARQVWR